MRFLLFVAASVVSIAAKPLVDRAAAPEASAACAELRSKYPDQTLVPLNLIRYQLETHQAWSTSAWLDPACVFTPSSAAEAAVAIQTFARLGSKFAMRGGGHMPIDDAANINSTGILLSSTKLDDISLSADQSYVSIGPGNSWDDVYKFLEPYGLSAVGGRIGMVGVAGFVLGGGISYFGNEYGLASTNNNVRAFQCVLANGTIVEATATNSNSDLYWALKGGGNSYCYATRFDLRTIAAPKVYVGLRTYGASQKEQWLKSVVDYANYGDQDVKGSIVPSVVFGPLFPLTYTTYSFYNGNNSTPEVMKNFSAPILPPQFSTWSYRSMADYSTETRIIETPLTLHRQRFYGQSFRADLDTLRAVHDMFMSAVQEQLYDIIDLVATLDFNVIPKNFIRASNSNGGSPQGLDEDGGPYIWLNEILAYLNPADQPRIDAFLISANQQILAELERRGMNSKQIYLNEIDKGQPVFQGYPAENVARLKQIRAKYDPNKVFTNLVPGGFKVESA